VPADTFAAGDPYEAFIGRWSRLVARTMLEWLHVPENKEWLDVGCGTGALTDVILHGNRPRSVKGIDPSAGFIAHARQHILSAVTSFQVGDAQALPWANNEFDIAVSGLALNFVPEPARAVSEMTRVVRPAGIVAAYVWDYSDKMELLRYFFDAAVALDPAATNLDEGRRFSICRPPQLEDLFATAGLEKVIVRPIDIPTVFHDFDDYWLPFLGGQGPAPAFAMSLDEERRNALRDQLRANLPIAHDGSISLVARAWAVRGNVPAGYDA
jgi:SAM-dependent methyltransferase